MEGMFLRELFSEKPWFLWDYLVYKWNGNFCVK